MSYLNSENVTHLLNLVQESSETPSFESDGFPATEISCNDPSQPASSNHGEAR